jgi:hypothetical protein
VDNIPEKDKLWDQKNVLRIVGPKHHFFENKGIKSAFKTTKYLNHDS